MGDEGIIDLGAWVRAREAETEDTVRPLALHGTSGERRRYVLPLWRITYLCEARWAGIQSDAGEGPETVVALDLRMDPPRLDAPGGPYALATADRPPTFRTFADGSLLLPLGETSDGVRWCIVIADREQTDLPEVTVREDLLFLAGECAGLLSLLEDPGG